jgi:threonine/homoserine/homoserine lactone efflux protein
MSLVNEVVGGAVVVTGVWAAWQHLTNLVIDNAKPEMTRSERASHWHLLAASVLLVFQGILLWTSWINFNSVDWTVRVVTGALLIWMAVSDLGSWRRSRAQPKTDEPPAAAS